MILKMRNGGQPMSLAPTKIVLGPESNGALMSPEEFDAVDEYDDNYRYELIRGVLVVNPVPLPMETGPNEELGYLLRMYRDLHPRGSALDLTLPEQYVRTADSRRRADRLIWAGLGRMPAWRLEVATIAAEFVSAGTRNRRRDYIEKRREYMALGILEYWIIDRFLRIMTVIRKQRGKEKEIVIHENEVYTTLLLPGFELPLARLLAEADRLDMPEEENPRPSRTRRR
jgi:Uma2 family endonuclease